MDNLTQTVGLDLNPITVTINESWTIANGISGYVPHAVELHPLCPPAAIYEAANLLTQEIIDSATSGEVGGVAQMQGQPFSGVILLYDEESRGLVASTVSDLNGVFLFTGLPLTKKYFVVGINPDLAMNHSIRAHLTPTATL